MNSCIESRRNLFSAISFSLSLPLPMNRPLGLTHTGLHTCSLFILKWVFLCTDVIFVQCERALGNFYIWTIFIPLKSRNRKHLIIVEVDLKRRKTSLVSSWKTFYYPILNKTFVQSYITTYIIDCLRDFFTHSNNINSRDFLKCNLSILPD